MWFAGIAVDVARFAGIAVDVVRFADMAVDVVMYAVVDYALHFFVPVFAVSVF